MVEWHHHTEETVLFPTIEMSLGKPGLLDGPKDQHDEFTPGLKKLLNYAQETSSEHYRWDGNEGMRAIIDDFSPSLTKQLNEEIEVFLSLDWTDSGALRKAWNVGEQTAKGMGKLNMLVSL